MPIRTTGGEAAISGERGQRPLGPERRAGKMAVVGTNSNQRRTDPSPEGAEVHIVPFKGRVEVPGVEPGSEKLQA